MTNCHAAAAVDHVSTLYHRDILQILLNFNLHDRSQGAKEEK